MAISKKFVGIFFIILAILMIMALNQYEYCQAQESSTQLTQAQQDSNDNSDEIITTTQQDAVNAQPPKEDGKYGVIGNFFRFLGDVVAFPFRLIAMIFDAIFK